ncbi:hypothetical protein Tco_0936905 [Tanacetum coccineum]|uniref:GRF-type domain-containing protein n=1 Tax=Tanacetum coccineum TaxID=301880 RepID=A0ABQ5DCP3_9ASTR
MASSSSSSRNRVLPTHCKCGFPLMKRTAWTEGNPCRRFLNCRYSNIPCKKNCNAFYWIDPEIYNQWYRTQMFELFLHLNPTERDEYTEQLRVQERFDLLETEYHVYHAEMETRLNDAEASGRILLFKIVYASR